MSSINTGSSISSTESPMARQLAAMLAYSRSTGTDSTRNLNVLGIKLKLDGTPVCTTVEALQAHAKANTGVKFTEPEQQWANGAIKGKDGRKHTGDEVAVLLGMAGAFGASDFREVAAAPVVDAGLTEARARADAAKLERKTAKAVAKATAAKADADKLAAQRKLAVPATNGTHVVAK